MGTVQLVGTARAVGEPLVTPFSGTETLTYAWRIKQHKPVSSSSGANQIGTGREDAPFVLEDETGEILVDPAGATISFEEEQVLETGDDRRPPESAVAIIEKDLHDTYEVAADSTDEFHWRRFFEQRLDPGEKGESKSRFLRTGALWFGAGVALLFIAVVVFAAL